MKKSNILIAAFVAALATVSAAGAADIKVDFDGKKFAEDIGIAYPIDLNDPVIAAELKARFSAEGSAVPAVAKGYVAGTANSVEWVPIRGGKFMMGTDEFISGLENARPAHEVTIETFEMSKTVVTVEQYAECVLKGKCTEPARKESGGMYCNWGVLGRQNHPVNCVTWYQADKYAKFKGARLPSESEWEYAATSGGKSQRYPWGNANPTKDLIAMTSFGTSPVCSKPAGNTEQGLCDMAGNVRQWVRDTYMNNSYYGAPADGSAVEGEDERVVTRGGSFNKYTPEYLRSDFRDPFHAKFNKDDIGFRIARSPAAQPVEWVSIRGGKFMMGTDDLINGFEAAGPLHEVAIKTFEISKTDVTVAQYAECVTDGKCTTPGSGGGFCNWGIPVRQNHPINCVTWDQADQYARFKGARLPSESEWEYAATSGGKDYKYPWGSAVPADSLVVMNTAATMPVCSKPAGNTAQGLCDMAGNVRQWVQDKYQKSYNGAPADGSAFNGESNYWVMRGGCFNSANYAQDDNYSRGFGFNSVCVGFRLAK